MLGWTQHTHVKSSQCKAVHKLQSCIGPLDMECMQARIDQEPFTCVGYALSSTDSLSPWACMQTTEAAAAAALHIDFPFDTNLVS